MKWHGQVCTRVCELPEVYVRIWCLVFRCYTVGDVHRWSAAVGRNDRPWGMFQLILLHSLLFAEIDVWLKCWMLLFVSFLYLRWLDWQVDGGTVFKTCPFICSCVTKLVNTILWHQMNQFWCNLARAVHGQGHWTINLWDQRSKFGVTQRRR